MILAILNLHVAPMPPTKFGLNLTKGSGAVVVSIFSRWPPSQPSWIAKPNDLSNSESIVLLQCLPSSFGSIQLKVWEDTSFKEFRLGYQN